MHQMSAAADFDVAFDRGLAEGIKQPARILVRHQPIPLAADDRSGHTYLSGIVAKLAVPGPNDLAERAERRFNARRITRAALRIAVEIAFAPFVEMHAR